MVDRTPGHDQADNARRLGALERENAALRGEAEQRRLILASATGYAIFTLDDAGLVTSWNTGAERLLRFREDEIVGREGRILFTPEDRAKGAPELEISTARANGRAENERWHVRKDGSRFWGSGLVMPLQHGVPGLLKIMRDETERRRADELPKLLIGELDHRVKNMLAMVRSVADQTLENVDSLAAFKTAFTSRLFALAGAHDLLTRETWVSADLQNLVWSVLRELDRSRPRGGLRAIGPCRPQACARPVDGVERACHRCRQIWRAVAAGRPGRSRLAVRRRSVRNPLEGTWRAAGVAAAPPRLRHAHSEPGIGDGVQWPVALNFDRAGLSCVISVTLTPGDQPS